MPEKVQALQVLFRESRMVPVGLTGSEIVAAGGFDEIWGNSGSTIDVPLSADGGSASILGILTSFTVGRRLGTII